MLILNEEEVTALLDLDRLREALGAAMAELSAGRVSLPPRVAALVPQRKALLGAMPTYLPASETLATKLVSVFPGNAAAGRPSHQAVVVVFDAGNGAPLAMMGGAALTAARTAAGSALATELLARADADVLAIVGSGVQARAHAEAIPRVRALRDIRVLGRDGEKAAGLAEWVERKMGVAARAVGSFAEAAEGAAIVCAATHAEEPVVLGRFLEPGTHVNSVGLHPRGRELDDETVSRARIVVESRAAALAEGPGGANDLIAPLREGVIEEDDIEEIGALLDGRDEERAPREITLYKSVGVAVQDAVAARLVLDAAREKGVGTTVAL